MEIAIGFEPTDHYIKCPEYVYLDKNRKPKWAPFP